ncbi:MAG TPA: hypothetical protein VF719_07255 [Abditibacteriaceae bacterium]|jgi:hypothetical protein
MASGGARPGAGRKKKTEKYGGQIAAAEDKIADVLPQLIERLIERALIGAETVAKTYEPAGAFTVDDIDIQDGPNGPRAVKVKRLVYPNKSADELVLVKTTITSHAPDKDAAKYLSDRLMGRPMQEIDVEIKEKQKLPDSIEQAMIAAWGAPDDEDLNDEPEGDETDEALAESD